MPSRVFCPFGYKDWDEVLNPNKVWSFGSDACAIHLWNEMWRRNDRDKNQLYHSDCLYERLKRKYLGQGCAH